MLAERISAASDDGFQSDPWVAAMAALASDLHARLRTEKRGLRIAVLDFSTPDGADCSLGPLIAEDLTSGLFQAGDFAIIERRMLGKVLAEHRLAAGDMFDPKRVARIGRLLGADGIVSGTISAAAEYYAINARIITAESSEIVSVAQARIARGAAEAHGLCRGQTLAARSLPPSAFRSTVAVQAPAPSRRQAARAPRRGAGDVFLDVSPSGRQEGDIVDEYGENLSVVRHGDKLVIGSQVKGGKTMHLAADFPEDWRLRLASILECGALDAITFIDVEGRPYRVDTAPPGFCWSSMTVRLPGGASGETPYRVGEVKENEIEIVKLGTTVKVLINSHLIVSARMPSGVAPFKEVRIDWSHKWKDAPAMFTRVRGEEL
jgi:TolB-like protein